MNPAEDASTVAVEGWRHGLRGALTAMSVLLVMSVMLNVFLAVRVQTFTHAQAARIAEYQLKIGTAVSPIAAKRLGGEQEVISYQGQAQPTVLYIFTPSCPWCARNLDNFNTLKAAESARYRFIGISLSEEDLLEYVTKNGYKLPVYSGLSTETLKAYKLGGTPQTIVVSSEGRVLQDWVGAYVGDQKSQIEAFFHVSLPGLRDPPKAKGQAN